MEKRYYERDPPDPNSPLKSVASKNTGGAIPKQRPCNNQLPTIQEEGPTPTRGGANFENKSSPSLSEIHDLVPFKPGTSGRKIQVETNLVRIDLGTLQLVYRYDVTITPEERPRRMLKEAMKILREICFPSNHPSYDGRKILYSAKKLPFEDDEFSGRVTLSSDHTQEFDIKIKLRQTLDLSILNDLLNGNFDNHREVFRCVDVVFRQAYFNVFINQGRSFVASSQRHLQASTKFVKGWAPFLNVDVAAKNYTLSTSLLDLLIEMFTTKSKPLKRRDLKTYHLEKWQVIKMNEYLKHLKIFYEIPKNPGFKRYYRVNSLASSSDQEIFLFGCQYISVADFFKLRWKLKLQYPNLPTLWVGDATKKICIPMELCTLKGGQFLRNRHTKNQVINNLKTTLNEVVEMADSNNHPSVKEFGFSLSDAFETLEARILDPPKLEFFDGEVEPKNGVWWSKKFKRGAVVTKWTCLSFGVEASHLNWMVDNFVVMLQSSGRSSGIFLAEPTRPFVYLRNQKSLLVAAFEKMRDYDLVIVIIPNSTDLYCLVKQEAEQTVGLLTQCIKVGTLSKLTEATVRNILLKINCKMNGTNHIVCDLALINNEASMVIGAEVSRGHSDGVNIPTVIAVTASCDLTATNYSTCVFLQAKDTDVIQNLETITLTKLQVFVEKTGQEARRIYFFRQGVGESEFNKIHKIEVTAIKKACDSFRSGYNPSVTFIIVQKRHHTRLFPTDEGSTVESVPVGTCVDTVITHPSVQNFYLMSHQCVRGVGRPTNYWVLYDENRLSNNDVETLTYYLCHVYTKCNKAVRYPAPIYFANLAVGRARGYLHNKNIDLENLDQGLVATTSGFAARNPMFFS